ncbi:MAG: septal ring lytic transglycosylase RlpA family protein [Gammaproteobacteria bacterium]
MTRRWLRHTSLGWVLIWAGALLLTGCGTMPLRSDGGPSRPVDVAAIPNAVPRVEPLSRFGNPSSYVVYGRRYYVMASSEGFVQRGIASWYGTKFYGRRTASGEPYNMYAMTAAHRTLPIPTFIRVTNLRNHRWVIVRVNDRGPFARNRILDLSWAAAAKLGMLGQGTAPVATRAIPRHAHKLPNSRRCPSGSPPLSRIRRRNRRGTNHPTSRPAIRIMGRTTCRWAHSRIGGTPNGSVHDW